jgi:Domain of unknown function (DUF4116)
MKPNWSDKKLIELDDRTPSKKPDSIMKPNWNDKEYVLTMVKQSCWNLEYASEDLKGDREIVLEAVKNDGRALEFASEDLKKDKEIVLEAVKTGHRALCFASEALKNDREVVLEAVKNNGDALKYASDAAQYRVLAGRRCYAVSLVILAVSLLCGIFGHSGSFIDNIGGFCWADVHSGNTPLTLAESNGADAHTVSCLEGVKLDDQEPEQNISK